MFGNKMIARLTSYIVSLLSVGWLVAARDWEPAIAVVTSIGAVLAVEIRRSRSGTPAPVIVDDVIVEAYPPKLDFRVRNPNESATTAISKILIKIIDLQLGPSPCGKQEVSDSANLVLDASVQKGCVLEVPIAIKVGPGETDRFVVDISWSGPSPDWGRFYTVLPALKTSHGFVQASPICIHIQEDFEKSGFHYADPSNLTMPPMFVGPVSIEPPPIDWTQEEHSVRRISGQ